MMVLEGLGRWKVLTHAVHPGALGTSLVVHAFGGLVSAADARRVSLLFSSHGESGAYTGSKHRCRGHTTGNKRFGLETC